MSCEPPFAVCMRIQIRSFKGALVFLHTSSRITTILDPSSSKPISECTPFIVTHSSRNGVVCSTWRGASWLAVALADTADDGVGFLCVRQCSTASRLRSGLMTSKSETVRLGTIMFRMPW